MGQAGIRTVRGLYNGDAEFFGDELYDRLKGKTYAGVPADMYVKYYKPYIIYPNKPGQGMCKERSEAISLASDKGDLARGKVRGLELFHGTQLAGHGWYESDDEWVYEPTTMIKMRPDLFTKMWKPFDIKKTSREELGTRRSYRECLEGKINEAQMISTIRELEKIAAATSDASLLKELTEFKEKAGFDDIVAKRKSRGVYAILDDLDKGDSRYYG